MMTLKQIKFSHKIFAGIVLLSIILCDAQAQTLPRRVYLGIRMENLTDDARKIMGVADIKGILIVEVLPQSTAEGAGFKKGDILLTINGAPMGATSEVIAYLGSQKVGDAFKYELMREKKSIRGKATFKPFPPEHYADIDMVYSEVQSSVGLQRIIISKPQHKTKLPVIVFIGGMGCYSLDYPLDTTHSEVQLLNYLTRAGFLCARAEKPGMGDNAKSCKPCNEISLNEETDGYVQVVKAMKKRADVDSSSVYIFGHSMGGVFAPLVAQKTTIKGVIAYGALGSNFLEYLMKSRKTIAEAYQLNPEESDDFVKDFCECAVYYFADSMTTAEATKKKAACGDLLAIFDSRSRAYNQELYALNLPSLWKSYNGKALLLWGESDYVSARDDHQMIADAVNYYHEGNATFLTIKNDEHGMHTANSFQEAKNNPGPYNPELGKEVLKWLQQQSLN